MYDAMGNRVCKIEKPYNLTSTGWKYTFYVRDASGNIMTTYTKTGSEIENNVLKLDEVMLYGSSRIGTREVNTLLSGLTIPTTTFSRSLGLKRYEVSNHLGNVLATFTDRKYQIQSSNQVTGYKTYIASAQDYYPFGMIMNERKWNTSGYRFGFNGQEKDNEIYGDGNATTALFWEYDTRIGRRWNRDPKPQIGISDYSSFTNNPILFADPLGDKVKGKTKEDAQKIKDEMAKSIGKDGKAFVDKFFDIDDNNELVFKGKDKKEMNKWMHKRAEFKKEGRKGDEFTPEQAALANGYLMMVRNKKYTVEVSFDDNIVNGSAQPDPDGQNIIYVQIGTPNAQISTNIGPQNIDRTGIFVHELLGEAFSYSCFRNMLFLEQEKVKYNDPADWSNNKYLRGHALHCIQAENLYNKPARGFLRTGLGLDHRPAVNPSDRDKVGVIPEIFNSTFNEQIIY